MDTEPTVTPDIDPAVDPAIDPAVDPAVPPADDTEQSSPDIFSLSENDLLDDTPDEGDDTQPESKEPEQEPEGAEFNLSDNQFIPKEMHSSLAELAKKSGIKGDVASNYLDEVSKYYAAEDKRITQTQAAELKEEWGADFDVTLKATKQFMARTAKAAGLTMDDMAVLASPRGMKLMNAMRLQVAEPNSIVGKGSPKMSTEDQIESIMSDPEQFDALNDTSHPNHRAVNAKLNRLYGIKQ